MDIVILCTMAILLRLDLAGKVKKGVSASHNLLNKDVGADHRFMVIPSLSIAPFSIEVVQGLIVRQIYSNSDIIRQPVSDQ